MEYSKIISVTGLGGLFELLSSKGDGAIVRSLDDKTTRFVSSRVHNFSHLESIEIFTVRENVNLAEVFLVMQKNDTALPNGKDNDAVKKYFEKVYPDMDFERVYVSDMKKMVKWLEILNANNIEIKVPEQTQEEEETETAEVVEETAAAEPEEEAKEKKPKEAKEDKEEKPKKAAAKKKEESAPAKETKEKKETKEAAPKKKAATKKATAAEEEAPKKKAAKKK